MGSISSIGVCYVCSVYVAIVTWEIIVVSCKEPPERFHSISTAYSNLVVYKHRMVHALCSEIVISEWVIFAGYSLSHHCWCVIQ